jgi:hypothetical protein
VHGSAGHVENNELERVHASNFSLLTNMQQK